MEMKEKQMMEFNDQMGNLIRLAGPPRRIISLVPSLTELLFDLGLEEQIVGVTDYCWAPPDKIGRAAKIGGPKKFDFNVIRGLDPDLAIGDKEENYKDGVLQLRESTPVWLSDVRSLEDALEMIEGVGELVDRFENARQLVDEIRTNFECLPPFPFLRTAYLVWKEPFLAAGGDCFINDMLLRCGFKNIFQDRPRYPEVSLDEIREAELILLPCEPCDFQPEDIKLLSRECPAARILEVDGTMFCWYGSRLKAAPGYYQSLRERLA